MQSAKEKASNAAASAKAALDKTKATVQEKGEKMTTRDPLQKDIATEKKMERVEDAELGKQAAETHNAAAKESTTGGRAVGSTGAYGSGI